MAQKTTTPKSNKMPTGVRQLPCGRYRVRATVTQSGVTKEAEETLPPGSSLGQAVDAREALLARLRGEVKEAEMPPIFQIYADTWLARRRRDLSPGTIRRIVNALEFYSGALLRLRLDEIDRRAIVRWRDQLSCSRVCHPGHPLDGKHLTRHGLVKIWRSVLQILRDGWADWDLRDPSTRLSPPESAAPSRLAGRAPSLEELRAILAALEHTHSVAYLPTLLMVSVGMRQGEVRGLLWSDVDLDAGVIHLRTEAVKTRRAREVPLPAPVTELLRQRRQAMLREQHPLLHKGLVFGCASGEPWSDTFLTVTIRRCAARLGLERTTPHDLRRGFITHAVEAGISTLTLRAIVGHGSEEMTQLYYRAQEGARRGAVEQLWESKLGLGLGKDNASPT